MQESPLCSHFQNGPKLKVTKMEVRRLRQVMTRSQVPVSSDMTRQFGPHSKTKKHSGSKF
eukprot:287324-Amphidinium_carterae.1